MIRFERVTVSFPNRHSPALLDLSFTASPGEVVALIGPSGCGKSTALGALLGFVEPESGALTISGHDLRGLDLRSWRAQVAWVPQHPHLFAGPCATTLRSAGRRRGTTWWPTLSTLPVSVHWSTGSRPGWTP